MMSEDKSFKSGKGSKMVFHVVSLPHTQTTLEYEACAYTSKVRKFCNMMKSLGHTVYLYASEDNEASCDELITIAPKSDQQKWFGGNNFKKSFFNITWGIDDEHWQVANSRAIEALGERISKKDFICLIGGVCQKQIADAFPVNMSVEFGIGYEGVFAPFRVYESYAHMHYVQGLTKNDNIRFYDTVIPNYYEPELFPYSATKKDYYLFLGRFIARKGPEIAVEVTKRIGAKLIMAGQGVEKIEGNKIIGKELTVQGDHISHIGHVDASQRAELLRHAKAVFMPTTYMEPFGGVSIESLLCGTPVIATDFGAFTETIKHGEVGYRFRTIGEAVWAAKNVHKLDSKKIHKYAVSNFSVDRVRYLYQSYFEQLRTLWEDGFYSEWHTGVSKHSRYKKF